ncbi:hypothetical protein FHT00_001200 [Sphingomonas insulae]|uniref:Uncharacterized protein n=1 Tax=Sphingomonas insulae TaxID=424800 RepID=A0ABN1HR14_9SPHN|nr:hypothetical protein [Sphingomonas insulae]NIJ29267.1 hypothetical protein [Sphingomonas insulae]
MVPACLALLASVLPPIGGVMPPVGTTLVDMDITPAGTNDVPPETYRIASALPPAAFRAAYAAAARRAGYETSSSARIVAGIHPSGRRFRLVLQPHGGGSRGILTMIDTRKAGN